MYTTDDHKEKVYEEIRDLMKLCDSYENEVTAISNGTMYLVEDYCTAGTIDAEERLQNKLYINNIQIMASRIRIMADKINSTLIQPITNMTYDPSEATQIFLEEVLLRINELTHSVKTSYNNIRLLYQYMTGKAPEAHTVECVIIPYLNFSSITEKDDENNDDVESEYPSTIPVDVRKVFEERLKEKFISSNEENSDTCTTSTDPIIDANTWELAGLASDYHDLPIACDNPHSVWIIAPDWELDYEKEDDLNTIKFYYYDSNSKEWRTACNKPYGLGFAPLDIAIFVQASTESGCFGKVDNIDYLPNHFAENCTVFSEAEGMYFKFINEMHTVHWVNATFDDALERKASDDEKQPDKPSNTYKSKVNYVWRGDQWIILDVWKMFEERLKAKVKEQDNSFDGIEEIDTIPEGTSFNDIIDKDSWIIAGFITSSDGKYLPIKTENPKEAWLVWPDFNKIDFPDEFDPNKYYFVHYDQDHATWAKAYRGNHSFSTNEIYAYIIGTIESGCIGKVDSAENLPVIGKDNDIIYVSDENKYYQFIRPIESWGWTWMSMMDKE